MKKLTYLAALAIATMAASCSSEEQIVQEDDNVAQLTLNLQLPEEIGTRAVYSDGLTATYLTYAVYRVNDDDSVLVDYVKRDNRFSNRQTTVTLSLVKGQSYKVVFWADAGPDCPYTVDLDEGSVTMDYASNDCIDGNNESRDAFYQIYATGEVTKSIETTIELYRPLAQLNFGTDDLSTETMSGNVASMTFELSVPAGLPTKFWLLSGNATDFTTEAVVFKSTGVPAESVSGSFPTNTGEDTPYKWVTMDYLLAGTGWGEDMSAEGQPITVLTEAMKLTATSEAAFGTAGSTVSINNVPLQRNYRTNIYGSLFTATGEVSVNVKQVYNDPDTDINVGNASEFEVETQTEE